MTSLDEIKAILSPLGFYNLENSVIEKELQCYAKVLDESKDYFSNIFNECFFQTVTIKGLERFERIFGSPETELSEEKRRENVLFKLSMPPVSFTLEKIIQNLRAIGFNGTITENAIDKMIILERISEAIVLSDYGKLIDKITEVFPAQLRFSFDIESPSWDEFESADATFSLLDSYRLPWDFYFDR